MKPTMTIGSRPLVRTALAAAMTLVLTTGAAEADNPAAAEPAVSAPLEEAFEQRVRDYIPSHPEVLGGAADSHAFEALIERARQPQ